MGMMSKQSRRHILKEDPLIKVSSRAILIPGLALDNGWALQGFYEATEQKPKQTIYKDFDDRHTIHFVDDEYIQVHYVLVRGPTPDDVLAGAEKTIPCFDDEELWELSEAAVEPWEHIRALYYLGVSAPREPEQRRIDYFVEQAQNDVPEIRRAAIVAMGYANWDSLAEALAKIAQEDADLSIRAHAASLREGYEQKTISA